jgi:hypothetical protein
MRRGSSGLKVVPGNYRVRLALGTKTMEEAIAVLPDPRLTALGLTIADYREQYDICTKVMKLQADARQLTRQVDTMYNPLRKKLDAGEKMSRKEKQTLEMLTPIRSRLVTGSGPYPQPMLNDQIGYLLSMISGVDQKPGRDAWIRLDELTAEVGILKKEYSEIR